MKTPYEAIRSMITLSHMQRKVVRKMVEGFSATEAAEKLGITLNTIRVHWRSVYSKLGITCREEMFALILKHMLKKEKKE